MLKRVLLSVFRGFIGAMPAQAGLLYVAGIPQCLAVYDTLSVPCSWCSPIVFATHYNTIHYSRCNTIQCNDIHYNTVQYSSTQYYTMHCNARFWDSTWPLAKPSELLLRSCCSSVCTRLCFCSLHNKNLPGTFVLLNRLICPSFSALCRGKRANM
jgi:hypothetical protein